MKDPQDEALGEEMRKVAKLSEENQGLRFALRTCVETMVNISPSVWNHDFSSPCCPACGSELYPDEAGHAKHCRWNAALVAARNALTPVTEGRPTD